MRKIYIITLLVLLVVILAAMEKSPVGSEKLEQLSGSASTLDMQFGYSQNEAYNTLDNMGSKGREVYVKLLCLDFAFIVVFALLQSLLFAALFRKLEIHRHLRLLNLLPFLRGILDIAENCLILLLLYKYPEHLPRVVDISSMITVSKFIVLFITIAVFLLLVAVMIWRAVLSKKKE